MERCVCSCREPASDDCSALGNVVSAVLIANRRKRKSFVSTISTEDLKDSACCYRGLLGYQSCVVLGQAGLK